MTGTDLIINGRLAQGAPTSPILSSIAMIPFVTETNNWAKFKMTLFGVSKKGNLYQIYSGASLKRKMAIEQSQKMVVAKKVTFSIYADDIVISINMKHVRGVRTETCIGKIEMLLDKYTPLRLNKAKTRYVDVQRKGGVWVTGLMINREHKVTIGREKKEKLKATIFSFLADCKNGKPWDEHRVRQMMGTVSYARYIEPEFVDMIIEKYNQKLGMDYHDTIKNILYS